MVAAINRKKVEAKKGQNVQIYNKSHFNSFVRIAVLDYIATIL